MLFKVALGLLLLVLYLDILIVAAAASCAVIVVAANVFSFGLLKVTGASVF